jgi:hypothetical protein
VQPLQVGRCPPKSLRSFNTQLGAETSGEVFFSMVIIDQYHFCSGAQPEGGRLRIRHRLAIYLCSLTGPSRFMFKFSLLSSQKRKFPFHLKVCLAMMENLRYFSVVLQVHDIYAYDSEVLLRIKNPQALKGLKRHVFSTTMTRSSARV